MSDRIFIDIPSHPNADYTILSKDDLLSKNFRKAMWGRPLKVFIRGGSELFYPFLDKFEEGYGDIEDIWVWYLDRGEGPYEIIGDHLTRGEIEFIWKGLNYD